MDNKLSAFRAVRQEDEIKPTGGTACAIAGAMAASLIGKVARASIGGRYASKSSRITERLSVEHASFRTNSWPMLMRSCRALSGLKMPTA